MDVLKFKEDKVGILLMINDVVGLEVMKYLLKRKENIKAILLPNVKQCKMFTEIMQASASVWPIDFYDPRTVTDKVSEFEPDVIITCYWPYLLKKEVIDIPKYGCINFHPSLLPSNRGWYPAIWPFIDGSLAGVTLHLIDEGADTGPILAQKKMVVREEDTAGDIYDRSQDAIIALFKEIWPWLYKTGITPTKQPDDYTYHRKEDGNAYNKIYPKDLSGEELINILKARTFGDKSFAYYEKNGINYEIKIDIKEI